MKLSLAILALLNDSNAIRLLTKQNSIPLPAFGASGDQLTVAGFSTGAFMTAELMVGWPETFICGSSIGGGWMNIFLDEESYSTDSTEAAYAANYAVSKEAITDMESRDEIGDQSLLSNNAIFVYGGADDAVVLPSQSKEVATYFEEMGAQVKFEIEEGYGHDFDPDAIAGKVANWCHSSLQTGIQIYDYTNNYDYLDEGYFRKFDQFEFAKSVGADPAELKQWGFYYFPVACETKSCHFQLTLHGCLTSAEEFSTYFTSYAAANDIIMVFPQAIKCFDREGVDPETDMQMTRTGDVMKFMKGIVDRALSPREASLHQDLEAGDFEFGTGYPEGTFVDTVKCDGAQCDAKNWTYDENTKLYTNKFTQETITDLADR